MDTTLRATNENDWKDLKEIRLAALLDSPTAFAVSHATAAAYSDAEWRERASPARQPRYVLAWHDLKPVGMVGDAFDADGIYTLIAMWVAPMARGAGIAERLVAAVQARARAAGQGCVQLSVVPDNRAAVRLYRKMGFEFIAQTEALASHPEIMVQRMRWSVGPA
jgi:ribosomal protein S18 acetylase RimI-like enzyme